MIIRTASLNLYETTASNYVIIRPSYSPICLNLYDFLHRFRTARARGKQCCAQELVGYIEGPSYESDLTAIAIPAACRARGLRTSRTGRSTAWLQAFP